MNEYQQILLEIRDGVGTITLNRPDKLNAWTAQMANEVHNAIGQLGRDKNSRCIVITGAGRGFCAGADMQGLQDTAGAGENSGAASSPNANTSGPSPGEALGPDLGDHYPGRFGYFYTCPKPIIAAINGPCAGIGLIMALYADLRYVDASAKLTTAFAARGLVAEHGIAWLLPRLIGEAKALDLLFTSRKFTGAEAAEMGLANQALNGETLMPHVMSVANTLAHDVSPRSVAVMKRQVRAAYHQSFSESLAVADAEMHKSFRTFDFKEGVQSFVQKRAPRFEDL
jgi:enoyl-CoA hydratase/carnithine racemase